MVINNRLAAVAASVGIALVGVLVGCSTPGRPASAGATARAAYPSRQLVPASFTAPVPLRPEPTGSAGGIDVTIATEDSTTVRPGGPPIRFSVTLVNSTATDIEQVGLVVSLSHCSCGMPGPRMMPQGSMRMLDPNTSAWVEAPYDREGTGMDYIYRTLVPPFELKRGETITYQLEMQINAEQSFTVNKGQGAINATRTDVTTHSAIGTAPTASLRISVEP